MGCFAVGCITILVVGFVFIVGAAGTAWYVFTKAADVLTTTEPADLKLVPPDRAQVRAAEGSLSRLKSAIATHQEATVGFTAADLNALINRDPDLEDMRGQIRIDIADSIMTVAVNRSSRQIPLAESARALAQCDYVFQVRLRCGII